MNNNLINLQEFASKLESYRATLNEMNELTEAEILRISSLGIKLNDKQSEAGAVSGKEAADFINRQMGSYLDKITSLIKSIPDYTVHGCFTTEELQLLQQRALERLKELGRPYPDGK